MKSALLHICSSNGTFWCSFSLVKLASAHHFEVFVFFLQLLLFLLSPLPLARLGLRDLHTVRFVHFVDFHDVLLVPSIDGISNLDFWKVLNLDVLVVVVVVHDRLRVVWILLRFLRDQIGEQEGLLLDSILVLLLIFELLYPISHKQGDKARYLIQW